MRPTTPSQRASPERSDGATDHVISTRLTARRHFDARRSPPWTYAHPQEEYTDDGLSRHFPTWGVGARALVLSVVTINLVLGPVLLRMALVRSGEVGKKGAAAELSAPSTAPAPTAG